MQNFHTIFKVINSYSKLLSMLENLGIVTFYEKNIYPKPVHANLNMRKFLLNFTLSYISDGKTGKYVKKSFIFFITTKRTN